MHPEMRAEMAQEYHREMENMRAARQDTPTPSHDIVAVDDEGNELFVTESAYSQQSAEQECQECNRLLEENPSRYPDVAEYRVKAGHNP